MKKLIFLALFATISFGFVASAPVLDKSVFASESKSFYAKILDEAYLYSQSIDSKEYRTFKLPLDYYVLLTGQANQDFYICRYSDVMGYVKKSDVDPKEGTPSVAFADFAKVTIKAPDGFDLRSSPNNIDNKLVHLNFLEDNVYYYGELEGEDYVPGLTKKWYYCKYVKDDKKHFGYVYSDYCYNLTPIPPNEEYLPSITPVFSNVEGSSANATSLSGTAKTLIIIGVCLPCLVVLYLLIKPTLISTSKKGQKIKSKRKHGDYFEFDESDLN